MKIGFVGLGKLGLPVALAVESKGHKVYGFDIKKEIYEQIKNRKTCGRKKYENRKDLKKEIAAPPYQRIHFFLNDIIVFINRYGLKIGQ